MQQKYNRQHKFVNPIKISLLITMRFPTIEREIRYEIF